MAADLPPEERFAEFPAAEIFRREAMAFHLQGSRLPGRLLELSPAWIPWAFRLLTVLFVAGLGALATVKVDHYAEGPFVVRLAGAEEPPADGCLVRAPWVLGELSLLEAPARTPDARPEIVALLPGANRPLLEPGMTLRLEPDGFQGSELVARVESIGDAFEAGVAASASFPPDRVLLHARPATASFEHEGRTLPLHDGMRGVARLRLGSQRLGASFFPALERFFAGRGHS